MSVEKIAKKYLKIYNNPEETKYVEVYDDVEDYINRQFVTYRELFERGEDSNIFLYLSLIKNPYLLGLATAFRNHDYELLHNAIYHYNKHRLLNIHASGYDHCTYLWEVLDSMACNDVQVIEKCYPVELGLSNNGYPFYIVGSNLLMALWYKNQEWMELAYSEGDKFLGQKKALWERAIVAYLMALSNHDPVKATEELSNVCKHSVRLDRPKLYKCFCTEAHGLYQLARYILPEEEFSRIGLPDNDNFCQGLISWQQEHGYPEQGKFIIQYPGELEVMNRILELPLPTCILEGSKKRTVAVDQMKQDLIAEFEARY